MSNILVMLSGGADSVYMLYKLLKETRHDIWAHHILIEHKPNRLQEEEIATAETVAWLTKNVRRFSFTKNQFTYPMELRVYPSDVFLVGFVGASMAVSFTLEYGTVFSKIAVGLNATDLEKEESIIRSDGLRKIMTQMFEQQIRNLKHVGLPNEYRSKLTLLETTPELWYPIVNESKTEIINSLPKELVELCWSCQKPRSFMEPCGYCLTCVELEKLKIFNIGQTLIKNKNQYINE